LLNLALTGNIASGKSTVAEFFRRWGATIIDADELVREVQAPGHPVLAAMVRRFGAGILQADGSLDRAHLRGRVLADPQALADLNAIVHPAVHTLRQERLARARAQGVEVVVSDIPLLFEAADPAAFDGVILVDAPTGIRRTRLLARSGMAPGEADRLMAAQMPAAAKRARATWVIDNDGDLAQLEARTAAVWRAATGRVVP